MKNNLFVYIKKLTRMANTPTRGTEQAAGCDLYAEHDTTIPPGETRIIRTGIAISIPDGFFGMVCSRSGLSAKYGLRMANGIGVIDSDYRGELMVPLYNDSSLPRYINVGDRVAQLIIVPYIAADFLSRDRLPESGRGNRGFGSTGK